MFVSLSLFLNSLALASIICIPFFHPICMVETKVWLLGLLWERSL
jgi:hypothetical protein